MRTLRRAWESGQKVHKLIGFDATEDHRTYATGGGISVCPDPALPDYRDRYVMDYPLREWGLTREDCGRIIVDAGLPLPPKSACFFCPSMKLQEILDLQRDEPELLALALEMERLYRTGRHFRGDNTFTVKAKHKLTGETEESVIIANNESGARDKFRELYDDTERPYRYEVRASPAVVGLSRDKTWASRLNLPMTG